MIFPEKMVFRVHAIKRMFERNISIDDIRNALLKCQVLKEYSDDTPYPSYLILGWKESRPIHIIAAINQETAETIIITAYEPTLTDWQEGFDTRRKNV